MARAGPRAFTSPTLPNPSSAHRRHNTEIPGGAGNFTRFAPIPPPITPIAPSISGQYVVFFGEGGEGQQGIYLVDVATPQPPPIMPVADGNTTIPGSPNNFQFFTALASEGNDVAFVGGKNGSNPDLPVNERGVYKVLNVLAPSPPPISEPIGMSPRARNRIVELTRPSTRLGAIAYRMLTAVA